MKTTLIYKFCTGYIVAYVMYAVCILLWTSPKFKSPKGKKISRFSRYLQKTAKLNYLLENKFSIKFFWFNPYQFNKKKPKILFRNLMNQENKFP